MLKDSIRVRIENEIKDCEERRRLLFLDIKKHETMEQDQQNNNNHNHYLHTSIPTPTVAAPSITPGKRKTAASQKSNEENNKKRLAASTASAATTVTHSLPSTFPYIVYRLSDWDILEDWEVIKKIKKGEAATELKQQHQQTKSAAETNA